MSAYLQRSRALIAAALLAFAVCFGSALAPQAYAESGTGGGDTQQFVAAQGLVIQEAGLSGDEEIVTIGEGTTTSKKTAPFYCYNNNGATETIYTADEVGIAGAIKALAWQADSTNTLTVNNLKIYLGHTSESAFNGSAITPEDLTPVYSSSEDFAGIKGYRQIVLDTPFEYNGSDNLLVVVVWAGNYSSAPSFNVESKSGMVWAKTSDNYTDSFADWETIRDATSPTAEYPSQRPNIQLSIEPAASAPKFTAQPEGFTYKVGDEQSTAISATAASKEGAPSFVWYKSDNGELADAAAVVEGATAVTEAAEGTAADGAYVSSYTPAASELTTVGTVYYYCVATGAVGSTASKPAAVQVYDEAAQAPTGDFAIASDPAAEDGVVTAGETTTVTFTASGAAPAAEGDQLYYQWYVKGADDADFVEIEGATEETYAAKVVMGETAYQCRVHASHQIESNVSEDVISNAITIKGEALTITTAEELAAFRDTVNSTDNFNGRTVLLGADIDISNVKGGWVPIGGSKTARRFAGMFDGQGHTITIGAIASSSYAPALFGYARGEATIKNLTVDGAVESAQASVAAVANYSYGATFENVRNLANVSTSYSSGQAAGIVATVGASSADDPTVFLNCVNKGNISVSVRDKYVSGIANISATGTGAIATFKDCYNTGAISGNATMYGDCYISGIVSINKNNNNANTLTNCYNAGTLSGGDYKRGYGLATKATLVGDNYYLESAPDGGVGTASGEGAAVEKTADVMASADFVSLLGESYLPGWALIPAQSTPVLAWEDMGGEPPANTPPTLAEGVEATAEAKQFAGLDWTIDLSAIFADAEGDALTYTVAVNDADAVAAAEDYSIETPAEGDTTLVFTANDGTADSPTYTVTLKQREVVTASVDFTSQLTGGFLHAPQFDKKVPNDEAERYGYVDQVEGVSALDVLVVAHELVFDDFTAESANEYLVMGGSNGQTVLKQFNVDYDSSATYEPSYSGMFFLNHAWPNDGTYTDKGNWVEYNGTTVATQEVADGDLVEFFFNEGSYLDDSYSWFLDDEGDYTRSINAIAGEELNLALKSASIPDPAQRTKDELELVNLERTTDVDEAQVYTVDLETGALTPIEGAISDEGDVTLTFDEPGEYYITAYNEDAWMYPLVMTLTKVTVEKANAAPTLAEGVAAAAEAEIANGQEYNLDLGSIFSDADEDDLTYTVSVNDAEAVEADADYKYASDENGTYTLVFKANDGKADSPAYTVTITVKDPVTIHVTVSISDKGKLVEGKDGEPVAQLPIELNGKLSYDIDDALKAAHDAAYEGGAEAGYETTMFGWGEGLNKLWGDTSRNFMYQLNSGEVTVSGLAMPLSDGDAVDAYITTSSYEPYAVFDKSRASVETGEALELTIKEFGHDENWNTVISPTAGAAVFAYGTSSEGAPVTDENGKASITFDKPGTYVVTASKTNEEGATVISAPVCVVTVTQANRAPEVANRPVAQTDYGTVGVPYSINLSDVFADADDDELTYTVSVDGAEAVSANEEYSFTPDSEGSVTFAFTANDGKVDSTTQFTLTIVSANETQIAVKVSISKCGKLVEGTDGKPVAQIPVELTGKGIYTIDDALKAAHDAAYEGGAEAGYSTFMSTWGSLVGKLWGDESGNFAYQVNAGSVYVSGAGDPIADGDAIDAYITQSYYPDTEAYAAFDSATATAEAGVAIELALKDSSFDPETYAMSMVPCSGAAVHVNGESAESAPVTDENGKVSLTFDEAGTYIVTATKTKVVGEETVTAITAPVCIVTVTPSKAALRDAIAAAEAADTAQASDAAKAELANKLEAAKAALENADATAEDIANAASDLGAATGAAVKDALSAAIAAAEKASTPDASSAANAALQKAIQDAKDILASGTATPEQLAAAQSALAGALGKANDEQAAADAAKGLPVGKTFTVKNKQGTWTYKVTATKQVMLTKAAKTKKKGKVTINTAAYKGITYQVTAIGPKALKASKLAKVTIGNNVTSIGKQAFLKNKALTKLTVGKSVASIGAQAFKGDKKLKKITVKSSKLTTAKAVKGALKGSKVKTVKLSGVKGAAKKQTKKAFKKAGKKGVKVK